MNTFLVKMLMAALMLAGVAYASDYAFVDVLSSIDNRDHIAASIDGDPSGGVIGGGLGNPLKSDSITALFVAIIEIILIFAVPIIVLFIMYAGFLYVTAQGDEGKIKTAHRAVTWAIVGGVIVLGAQLIIQVIQTTVESI